MGVMGIWEGGTGACVGTPGRFWGSGECHVPKEAVSGQSCARVSRTCALAVTYTPRGLPPSRGTVEGTVVGPMPHSGSDAGGVPGARGWLWGGQGSRTHISWEAQRRSHAHVRPFSRPAPPLRDFSLLSKPPFLPPSKGDGQTDGHWSVSHPSSRPPPSLPAQKLPAESSEGVASFEKWGN